MVVCPTQYITPIDLFYKKPKVSAENRDFIIPHSYKPISISLLVFPNQSPNLF